MPLGADRYALQLTISQATHDKVRRAQELLGHRVPPDDLAQLLDRALDALLAKLGKQWLREMKDRADAEPQAPPSC